MTEGTPTSPSVLMVVDQLPFPPRNGVTLPTFHYADGLRKTCHLNLVLIADEAQPFDQQSLAENEAIFGPIPVIRVRRKRKIVRAIDEVLARDMFNQGWELASAPLSLMNCKADVLLASPFSAAAKWEAAALSRPEYFACRIAAVSDCTAAEYHMRHNQDFGSLRQWIKGRLDSVRSSRIAAIECRILEKYQHVLLQTAADQHLMKKLVGDRISEKVILLPNGVRGDFFKVLHSNSNDTFIFNAELSSEYASIAYWLVSEVWPEVIKENPKAKLLIIGKGASVELIEKIASTPNVDHVTFVDDLSSVYSRARGAICPVFKGYGLINKALEAMAAGVPVIGGAAAFNGIPGFVAGVHGLVCLPRNTQDFVAKISDMLKNHEAAQKIGAAGKLLIKEQFQWEKSLAILVGLIHGSRNNYL